MIHRLPFQFTATPLKVILLYLDLSESRIGQLIQQIDQLSDEKSEILWKETKDLFEQRHRNFTKKLDEHIGLIQEKIGKPVTLTGTKRKLLGAYATKEYSTQAAALFNPSIVVHPNQDNLLGATRFIMSLRATGEGHISSICFKEGVIDSNDQINFLPDTKWQTTGAIQYSGDHIPDEQYKVNFPSEIPVSERILFPQTASESMGMEDLRLVRFSNGGSHTYLGTFTAYDGKNIQSKLLKTDDFKDFEIHALRGSAIQGKGIAIFPRKINDLYVATGRQDGVNMSIMFSEDLLQWDHCEILQRPEAPHELVQLGNCGSPIETSKGWLLLTHAVGPMRRYVLGVSLLDLEHPEKLINKLTLPLMAPTDTEREGYVPNVLYTCGWLAHQQTIIIPYATSDAACSFAKISIQELLETLLK